MSAKDQSAKSTDVPFYTPELEKVDPSTREVLEKYSKISPDEVVPHILKIRDAGWEVYRYPCIGQFRFLDLSLGKAKQYPEVLDRVKQGQRLLDLGCCFGQDIRRLVADGAPNNGSNLYGSDLLPKFFDLGYDLFRDEPTLEAHFIAADIFAKDSPLQELYGTVDMIHASSFLHLFDWDLQIEVVKIAIKLLKPVEGSLMLGRHMGDDQAGVKPGLSSNEKMYRHNEESWRKLWEVAGEQTGTQWKVDFAWEDRGNWTNWQGGSAKPMRYAVWRK